MPLRVIWVRVTIKLTAFSRGVFLSMSYSNTSSVIQRWLNSDFIIFLWIVQSQTLFVKKVVYTLIYITRSRSNVTTRLKSRQNAHVTPQDHEKIVT